MDRRFPIGTVQEILAKKEQEKLLLKNENSAMEIETMIIDAVKEKA